MTRLFFSNTANQTLLSAGIVPADVTIPFSVPLTGWPSVPFKAVIAPDTTTAEVILVTAIGTSSFTAVRGQDGTVAGTFSAGTAIEHRWSAAEADEANLHVNSSSGVHGTTGSVVGTTDAQTLTNKTLTTPTLNNPVANASASAIGLAVKAAASGTQDLTQWQSSGGTSLAKVNQSGQATFPKVDVLQTSPAVDTLVVRGAAAQTGALLLLGRSDFSTALLANADGRLVMTPTASADTTALVNLKNPGTAANFLELRNSSNTIVARWGAAGDAVVTGLTLNANGAFDKMSTADNGFRVDQNNKITAANFGGQVAFTGGATTYSGINSETFLADLQTQVSMVSGRKYKVEAYFRVTASAAVTWTARIRDSKSASAPTTSSTAVAGYDGDTQFSGGSGQQTIKIEDQFTCDVTGTHTLGVTIARTTGSGTIDAVPPSSGQKWLAVYDLGT